VHVLLLSYNRADVLHRALKQLAATDYGNYAVYMADNGSEDGCGEVLERGAGLFPDVVPVDVELLPTNIGRPGGHNWLLTRHDHSEAEFIAIADDDLVRIPADWLKTMVNTAKRFPAAAVVGGKALTPGEPPMIHGGPRRLEFWDGKSFRLSNTEEVEDVGQFDHIEKVDHVTGCLHIYRRKFLDRIGLFDIRFSPCQLVDIEHHLRTRLMGYEIIYNGQVAFEHDRGMGQEAASKRDTFGNSLGNAIKLLHKYDARQVRDFMRRAGAERRRENPGEPCARFA
jgi:GT2 family glycosyltransferase